MYKNWIHVLLGIVLIGVAFTDLSAATSLWILSIAGVILIVSNVWNLLSEPDVTKHV